MYIYARIIFATLRRCSIPWIEFTFLLCATTECWMWNVPFCTIASIVPCKITHTFEAMAMCIREAMNEQRHKAEISKNLVVGCAGSVTLSSPSLSLVTRRHSSSLVVFILFYARFCVFFLFFWSCVSTFFKCERILYILCNIERDSNVYVVYMTQSCHSRTISWIARNILYEWIW